MEELFEKLANLRAMCQEFEFDNDSKEGRMFLGILDVLDNMTDVLSTSVIFADTDENYYSYSVICPSCGEEISLDEEDMEEEQEMECPKCGDSIIIGAIGTRDLRF